MLETANPSFPSMNAHEKFFQSKYGRKGKKMTKISTEDFIIVSPPETPNPFFLFENMKLLVNNILEDCNEINRTKSTPSKFEKTQQPVFFSKNGEGFEDILIEEEQHQSKSEEATFDEGAEEGYYEEYEDESYYYQDYYEYKYSEAESELEERCFGLSERFEKDSRWFNWKKTKWESKTLRPKQSEKTPKGPRFVNSVQQRRHENQEASGKLLHFAAQKGNIEKRVGKLRTANVLSFARTSDPGPTQTLHASNDPTDRELARAIEASRREYDNELRKNTRSESQRHGNHLATGFSQRLIEDLQNRELTPEDYELLLLLDASVAPKTLSSNQIKEFHTRTFSKECGSKFEITICSICLVDFDEGDTVKELPCGHYFHEECIDQWLSKSATTCPVDNISLKT